MATTVFVCSDCDRHGPLLRALRRHTAGVVVQVGCQKVCKGPVAGLVVDRRMEWFGRLDTTKSRAALVRLVNAAGEGELGGSLRKRRSSERSGRKPR